MNGDLMLSDLRNPRGVRAIFHGKRGIWIERGDNQGFQEYPRSWELWEKLEDGRLLRVMRWLKRSIIAVDNEEGGA